MPRPPGDARLRSKVSGWQAGRSVSSKSPALGRTTCCASALVSFAWDAVVRFLPIRSLPVPRVLLRCQFFHGVYSGFSLKLAVLCSSPPAVARSVRLHCVPGDGMFRGRAVLFSPGESVRCVWEESVSGLCPSKALNESSKLFLENFHPSHCSDYRRVSLCVTAEEPVAKNHEMT